MNMVKKSRITRNIVLILSGMVLLNFIIQFVFLDDLTQRALLGDSFGSLNAMFSGFALLGVLYTIIQQSKELELQRTELKMQRNEFTLTRITNVIYNQIRLLNEILSQLEFQYYSQGEVIQEKGKKGIDLFQLSLNKVYQEVKQNKSEDYLNSSHPYNTLINLIKPNIYEIQRLASLVHSNNNLLKNLIRNSAQVSSDEKTHLAILFKDNIDKSLDSIFQLLNKINLEVLPKLPEIFADDLITLNPIVELINEELTLTIDTNEKQNL